MNESNNVVVFPSPSQQDETDYGALAQKAAEEHLTACWEAYWAEEECESLDELPESPACAPFCGCETCVVREVLYAAWPIIEQATAEP